MISGDKTSIKVKPLATAAELPSYPAASPDLTKVTDKSEKKEEKKTPESYPESKPGHLHDTDNKTEGFETPDMFVKFAVDLPFKIMKFLDKADPRWDLNDVERMELEKYTKPVLEKYLPDMFQKYPAEIALGMCLGSVIVSKASKPRQKKVESEKKEETTEGKTFTEKDNVAAADKNDGGGVLGFPRA